MAHISNSGGDAEMDDLEALRAVVESLHRDSKEKGNLLKIVSHDLLSPATAISGLTKLLLKPNSSANYTEGQLRIIQTLDRAMDQYLCILGNMIELSGLLRNRIQLAPRKASLADVVTRCQEAIAPKAAAKGIIVTLDRASAVDIHADVEKTERTIMRLLENAVMFTKPGGAVEIACGVEGPMAVVAVKDNGVGMDAAQLEKVFSIEEKRFTLGTCDERGSGLGLAIAKRIATLNGGDIRIESTPGEGTCASLLTPMAEPGK